MNCSGYKSIYLYAVATSSDFSHQTQLQLRVSMKTDETNQLVKLQGCHEGLDDPKFFSFWREKTKTLVTVLDPEHIRKCIIWPYHEVKFSAAKQDYCNSLLSGCPNKCGKRLQLVQIAAAWVLTGSRNRDLISPSFSAVAPCKTHDRIRNPPSY